MGAHDLPMSTCPAHRDALTHAGPGQPASRLLNLNVPIPIVSGRLAHARASTTLNVYAHAVPTGRAVRARGHFPSDQAALKCLYLTLRSLDPTGRGRQRWAIRWKPALNAFALMFEGRIIPNQ
jgi:hypothetical protein